MMDSRQEGLVNQSVNRKLNLDNSVRIDQGYSVERR